jgi:hypothetical protein
MGLEQNNEQHYREVPDKYREPTNSYQMTTFDYVMRPTTDTSLTLTLPPVAEAKGRIYTVICRGSGDVTIEDKDDSECWGGDITLTNKCEAALFYSDGLTWLAWSTFASPSTRQEN